MTFILHTAQRQVCMLIAKPPERCGPFVSMWIHSFGGEGSLPTCIGMHANQHLYEVRTCPQILKFFTKNHSTTKYSPYSSLVRKVETESLVLFSSVREGKKLRRSRRSRKSFLPAENFTQASTKSSNCCSLAASFTCSSYQSNVPSVVKCTTQPWKILAVYQTSMGQKFKALAWQ